MKLLLNKISEKALNEIEKIEDLSLLENIKIKYLGKKGDITQILKNLNTLSDEEKPIIGKFANDVKCSIKFAIIKKEKKIKDKMLQDKLILENIDISIPGNKVKPGRLHPLTVIKKKIEDVFLGMGFEITDGPEIEYVYYNFDALNVGKSHPSRDWEDTFYIKDDIVLRTQTSSVQIRSMKEKRPPVKLISPGRVYRSDSVDATHSPMFHQMEGLVIDKNVSMSDLKWTLETFVKKIYGSDINIRFRPHHFPFTEPSVEVDMSCFVCKGKGCKLCKNEGYIELLGAGMVHPNVLKNCDINPAEYSGFAFGLGLDRFAMMMFNIDDLRLLYENDIRFLSQF